MFTSVSETQRALIMPRLALADSGMLRARSRDGLAVTQTAQQSSNTGLVLALVVTLLLVLAGGAVLFWRMSKKPVASVQSNAPIVMLVSAAAEPAPPPKPKSYKLQISPARARVSVDGHDTPIAEDGVVISGIPGDTRRVRVEHEGKSRETVVAVTASGLVPSSIELAKPVTTPKRPEPVKSGTKPATSEPKTTKPKPKLENEWPG
jgi:hypothetical protein